MTSQSRKIRLIPGKRSFIIRMTEDEVSDYLLDWSRFLDAAETVSTVSVANATNITIDSSSSSGQTTTHFLSGAIVGSTGRFDVKIVTSNATPRTFERRIKIITESY